MSDFGTDETSETFHSSSNSPSLIEMLNSAGVINAVSLSILAEIWSCPMALVVSGVDSRPYTSSSLQKMSAGQRYVEDKSALVQVENGFNSSPRKVCYLKVRGRNDVTTS